MKLTSNCIYGYLKENSTVYLSSHTETPDGGSSVFGVFKIIENGNDLKVIRVNYASQIGHSYINFVPNGNYGNIITLSSFLFIPYYQRTGSGSYDVLLKYSKKDLYLLKQITVQSKEIQATHQGIYSPVLTAINNLLYYLIDNKIYVYEPNDLVLVGLITIANNYEGRGISSFTREGVPYLSIIGNYIGDIDTQYVLFIRGDSLGSDKFGKAISINSLDIAQSLSLYSSDKVEAIEGKIHIYG